jgi:sugar lactone lactonase YvrE
LNLVAAPQYLQLFNTMLPTIRAELLFLPDNEPLRFLPEGPYGLGNGKFSWVGIQHGASATNGSINVFDLKSRTNQSYELPGRPGFARPTSLDGTFIVGCERELGLFDINSRTWKPLASGVDSDISNTIINDGTIYADNIVFGTKDLEFKTKKAGLYLYRGHDGALIRLRSDQICSNGKDIVSSGGGGLHLYDIDTPTKRVVRYRLDIKNGTLTDCETVIDLTDLESFPDGMCLTPDEQSTIISFYNPNPAEFGETRQYSLIGGELERVWLTASSPQVTCPLLIEDDEGNVKLVITTAVEHMPAVRRSDSPLAGALFIADTDFNTAPPAPQFPIAGLKFPK